MPDGTVISLAGDFTPAAEQSGSLPAGEFFASIVACRSGATKSTATCWKNGSCCNIAPIPSISSYRLLEGTEADPAAPAAGPAFPAARCAGRHAVVETLSGQRCWATALKSSGPTCLRCGCISASTPGAFVLDGGSFYEVEYALERERGYAYRDVLWSPGYFRAELTVGEQVALVASTESWEAITAATPDETLASELSRRKRLIEQADRRALAPDWPPSWCWRPTNSSSRRPPAWPTPPGRMPPATRSVRVIAGYHWFTDWGRDTMISLDGLTLATGRFAEAGYILRTFSHYVRDGLIPNLFPEGAAGRPVSHGRRHALVFPRHRPLRPGDRRPANAARH